ncbi:3-hydroxyisobutyrate dehydrogenase [Aliidongia dinghuensis]|uniref:3-hydroxyisobutyrate dehydrogenase n=2 Tax=Aliidongia dinghuensis TaxID=1867774 RepID=A0A8J2YYR2_9PROT|nr:3-hydroxyisobutyrate dehydrogenase [Aliidongia dinghuensis]
MGLGMAQTLAGKDFDVLGFDLSAERCTAAAASNVGAPRELPEIFSAADFIVFSLPTARDVAGVVNDHIEQLGRRSDRRVIIIDTSTSEPDVSRELAQRLAAAGHGFLDAPVSGGPGGAATGKLAMMIGGTEEDVALARPVIEAMAAKILHVGPSGAGNVAKLVNNLLVAAHMITTSEGLKLAAAAGVSPEAALRVINAATGRSAISEIHFPTWIMSERFDSGFSMGLMRKDVRLARELTERAGADLPLTGLIGQIWAESAGRLADSDDFTRMGDFRTPAASEKKVATNG